MNAPNAPRLTTTTQEHARNIADNAAIMTGSKSVVVLLDASGRWSLGVAGLAPPHVVALLAGIVAEITAQGAQAAPPPSPIIVPGVM